MSAPDFREWLWIELEDGEPIWPEIEAVLRGWQQDVGGRLMPRLTIVNGNWVCLDAWRWPDGAPTPDQGIPPTEADIPVGFV